MSTLLMMYEKIARYYDLVHADLRADIGYALILAKRMSGPVLELGCGTGRLLLPLARAGYNVTGIDNSAAMLAQLRFKLLMEAKAVWSRIKLVEGDVTQMPLLGHGYFSLVLLPYNTLLHLDMTQIRMMLQGVRGCLRKNGRLFIDIANPVTVAQTPEDASLTLEQMFIDPETKDIVLLLASNQLALDEQKLTITWLYDASPATGGPISRTITQATYHYYYPHQMELLLGENGFKIETLMGNYDESPFTEDSERLLITATPK